MGALRLAHPMGLLSPISYLLSPVSCLLTPAFLKLNLEAAHPLFHLTAHVIAGVVEDRLHPLVIAQDFGGKPADTAGLGNGDQVAEEKTTEALVLPLVANDKGDLGQVGALIEIIPANGDDIIPMGLGHGADNGHVLAVIDIDEILNLFLAEPLIMTHEPVIERLFGQIVKQLPHQRLIGGMDGPKVDLGAVVKKETGLHQILGGDHEFTLHVGEFPADVPGLDGLLEKLLAMIGMGDGDQGQRPVLHRFAVQIGHPVFSDHIMGLSLIHI